LLVAKADVYEKISFLVEVSLRMTVYICGNLCRFDKGEMGGRVDWREDQGF
jgi:hypothetical protein